MSNRKRKAAAQATEPTGPVPALTAKQLLSFLRRRHDNHDGDKWIYLEELTTATGAQLATRIDAWAMGTIPSLAHQRISYEVKISRSDFLREVRTPAKRKYGMLYSNLFYFVTPRGLVAPTEVPDGCGLMEYNDAGQLYTPVSAPWRDTTIPTWAFLASVGRRLREESQTRALAALQYEVEHIGFYRKQQEAELSLQKRRANLETQTSNALWDAVRTARKEIDAYRKEMGVEPINWRDLALAATESDEREEARYSLSWRF